jgi:2-aminomuconate deaminase
MAGSAVFLPDRARPLGGYPHARRVGDLLFVSGVSSRRADNSHRGVTVRTDADGREHVDKDIAEQTHGCIEAIAAIVEAAGGTLADVVDITTFLVSMDDFAGYNAVYGGYFDSETGPARTTVAVRELPHPHLLIEMKAVAALPRPAPQP